MTNQKLIVGPTHLRFLWRDRKYFSGHTWFVKRFVPSKVSFVKVFSQIFSSKFYVTVFSQSFSSKFFVKVFRQSFSSKFFVKRGVFRQSGVFCSITVSFVKKGVLRQKKIYFVKKSVFSQKRHLSPKVLKNQHFIYFFPKNRLRAKVDFLIKSRHNILEQIRVRVSFTRMFFKWS